LALTHPLLGAQVADLEGATLMQAELSVAILRAANLREADLCKTDLRGANLEGAQFIGTHLCGADPTGSSVYGTSVWKVEVDKDTKQQNLIITERDAPAITVDNVKVAQFIYLLLNNQEIRDVIDTVTSKAVLILDNFSDERKLILDAICDELRKPEHNYLPIAFDFPPSASQTLLETVKMQGVQGTQLSLGIEANG